MPKEKAIKRRLDSLLSAAIIADAQPEVMTLQNGLLRFTYPLDPSNAPQRDWLQRLNNTANDARYRRESIYMRTEPDGTKFCITLPDSQVSLDAIREIKDTIKNNYARAYRTDKLSDGKNTTMGR